eukprot:1786284-Rhodomonas_salina.2
MKCPVPGYYRPVRVLCGTEIECGTIVLSAVGCLVLSSRMLLPGATPVAAVQNVRDAGCFVVDCAVCTCGLTDAVLLPMCSTEGGYAATRCAVLVCAMLLPEVRYCVAGVVVLTHAMLLPDAAHFHTSHESGADLRHGALHPEIKCTNTQTQHSLYQECVFLHLVSQCTAYCDSQCCWLPTRALCDVRY